MASLVRRDSLSELSGSWQRDIERVFRSIAESFGGIEDVTSRTDWMPATDVLTRGDDLVIRLEVPGIDPERDLDISVEDGLLRIRGERREEEEEKGEGYLRREASYGVFERAVRLPGHVNADDLKANYDKGVLEIVVPSAAKRPTQRVAVNVGSVDKEGRTDGNEAS